MAVNIKNILAEGLIKLCETQSLERISVKEILNETGVSRQSFYNHFLDKNDLIQYVYTHKVIPDFSEENESFSFRESLLRALENMLRYHVFMKQACMMEGQNCLKDYIFSHCKTFDMDMHRRLYGEKPMPPELKFATEYHSMASCSMTISWIISDNPISCEELAGLITELRSIGMDKLFANGETKGNPYR